MRATAALALALAGCAAAPEAWVARSPDGAHEARVLGAALTIDGRRGTFREVDPTTHAWTDRGLAIAVRDPEGWRVLHAGEPGPPFEQVAALIADGSRLAYAARDERGWRVVLDGEAGPAHDAIVEGSLTLARGRVAYVARGSGAERAFVDGRAGPAFERVVRLGFFGKGAAVAYVGLDADGAALVVDRVATRVDAVRELALAPDEPRWAALVERGDATWLIGDGEAVAVHDRASDLVIAEDGARRAWLEPVEDAPEEASDRTADTEAQAVRARVDGVEVGRAPRIRALTPVPRTNALAYVAIDDDGERAVFDGRAGPRFARVELTVGPGRWGYVGHRASGTAVVVDGAVVFRGPWAGALRLSAERWACVVRRGGQRAVLTEGGDAPIPRPLVDTLVLDGARWAIAVADEDARALRVWVDGHDAAPFDVESLAAELGRGADGTEAARAIVARALR